MLSGGGSCALGIAAPEAFEINDDQRRRFALKAKRLEMSRLKEVVAMVSPQFLLAWHRKQIAGKCDST